MKIYLDVCCLNRPFDDQSQERNELGKGDYTAERHQWLDQLTVDDVLKLAHAEQDNREE